MKLQPSVKPRSISAIAYEIDKEWGSKVNYAALPYLAAMKDIVGPNDMYGDDSAKSIVLYFLSNAVSFRGPKAKALKAELRSLIGVK